MGTIVTTAKPMTGGQAAVAGLGKVYRLTFSGTWASGDRMLFTMTNTSTGLQTQVGDGYATGAVPTYALTLKNKLNFVAGTKWFFSAVDEPTVFNDINAVGNGFLELGNTIGTPQDQVSLASYQGRIAVFSTNSIQIWSLDALTQNYSLIQVLDNIGTIAPHSVQSVGDLDVLFLSSSGIRSLRVRDSSNNAFVNDLGSAIDQTIIAKLQTCSAAEIAAAQSVVEPTSNRYWLFLKDTIYVFSYFPQNKIIAWGSYTLNTFQYSDPGTHEITTQTFSPEWFTVYNNQVYVLGATDAGGGGKIVLVYGGTDNKTYDTTQMTAVLPFYDAKNPGDWKRFNNIDVDMTGSWTAYITTNYASSNYGSPIPVGATPTFDSGKIPCSQVGTHFSMKLVSDATAEYQKISSLIAYYQNLEPRK